MQRQRLPGNRVRPQNPSPHRQRLVHRLHPLPLRLPHRRVHHHGDQEDPLRSQQGSPQGNRQHRVKNVLVAVKKIQHKK